MAENLEIIIKQFPRLYHMATEGSWTASIKTRGLLSTEKLCDLFEVEPQLRNKLLREHRPESVQIKNEKYGTVVIRDQKPMSIKGLQRALKDIAPEDWLAFLNERVFFWPSTDRLTRMISARPYAPLVHDVLVVDSKSLLTDYAENLWLSPINSGCTTPFAHPRERKTFAQPADYPLADRIRVAGNKNMVAELAIKDGVPDISKYVVDVVTIKGSDIKGAIRAKKL
jgi:hypothetical protein